MNMKAYKPRVADQELKRKLAGIGAVLIEGPKWCGKTTTAEQQAATIIYMDEPLLSKTESTKAPMPAEGSRPESLVSRRVASIDRRMATRS